MFRVGFSFGVSKAFLIERERLGGIVRLGRVSGGGNGYVGRSVGSGGFGRGRWGFVCSVRSWAFRGRREGNFGACFDMVSFFIV